MDKLMRSVPTQHDSDHWNLSSPGVAYEGFHVMCFTEQA